MAFIGAMCAQGNHNQSQTFSLQSSPRQPIWSPRSPPWRRVCLSRHGCFIAAWAVQNLLCNPGPSASTFPLGSQPSPSRALGAKCRLSVPMGLKHHTQASSVPSWLWWVFSLPESCTQPPAAGLLLDDRIGRGAAPRARFLLPPVWHSSCAASRDAALLPGEQVPGGILNPGVPRCWVTRERRVSHGQNASTRAATPAAVGTRGRRPRTEHSSFHPKKEQL